MTLSPLQPPRTLEQVKQTLARAKKTKADNAMACGMLQCDAMDHDA